MLRYRLDDLGWFQFESSYSETSSTQEMIYEEVWLSETFEQPFTALTVTDSNGNAINRDIVGNIVRSVKRVQYYGELWIITEHNLAQLFAQ